MYLDAGNITQPSVVRGTSRRRGNWLDSIFLLRSPLRNVTQAREACQFLVAYFLSSFLRDEGRFYFAALHCGKYRVPTRVFLLIN